MPRAAITSRRIDLNTDNGAVLWSIIQGEQFEVLLTLKYLTDITGMAFRAALAEGLNLVSTDDETTPPTTVRPGGVYNELSLRVPSLAPWSSLSSYVAGDLVLDNGKPFECIEAVVGQPTTDTSFWVPYVHNRIYLQFTKGLSTDWAVQPLPAAPVYGFFELSVTDTATFEATRKTVRGLAEFLFSPLLLVP